MEFGYYHPKIKTVVWYKNSQLAIADARKVSFHINHPITVILSDLRTDIVICRPDERVMSLI